MAAKTPDVKLSDLMAPKGGRKKKPKPTFAKDYKQAREACG